ncbi:MAG: YdeI/OmpD-associated family protein, partial [Blastococcus sp.]
RSNRLDDRFYLQRMTPRRARSVWSRKNVDAVEALTLAGRMRPPGLAAEPAAQAAFDGLDGANRYAVLWRVHTAASETTRAKRIASLVQMLAEGRRIH